MASADSGGAESCRVYLITPPAFDPVPFAGAGNPVDTIATASADDYRRTLQTLADGLPDDLLRHLRTVRRDLAALEGAGFRG